MSPLPGHIVDLLTEGADLAGGRSAVVTAVRSVMLSAHRHGVPFSDVHTMLADHGRYRLAHQLAHGKGGRQIGRAKRETFIRALWDDTAAVAARRPAITPELARGFVAYVRDQLHGDTGLTDRQTAVMHAVLDLANHHGTTRPAVPVRVIADATGLPRNTAHRTLVGLAEAGEWLSLARRGDRHRRRAGLYRVAPGLLPPYMGAPPPMSQPPPMSHPPTSHSDGSTGMVTISIQDAGLSPERQAQVLQILADEYRERAAAYGHPVSDEAADQIARARLRVMQGGAS